MRGAKQDQDRGVRTPSRRAVLRAAVLAVTVATPVTGCDFDSGPEPAPSADPLAPLLAGALDLATRHEAALAAFPELAERLNPVAQAHRAHAAELARVTRTALPSGTAGTGTPGPAGTITGDVRATLAALRTAEQQAHEAAAQACLAAPEDRAALLGDIAAARATHLEVLR